MDADSRSEMSINEQLKKIADEAKLEEQFENQRRNIGKAYGIATKIREASKDGIYMLKNGDLSGAEECADEMRNLWEELIRLDLPKDLAWNHQSEAGQEMVEFIFVKLFWEMGDNKNLSIPSPQDLMVSPQCWFAGIGDSITELGKLMLNELLNPKLTIKDRIRVYEKHLGIYRSTYNFLEKYEKVYGLVINNSRRRGYGNSYRGLVLRIQRFIERQEEKLIELYSR